MIQYLAALQKQKKRKKNDKRFPSPVFFLQTQIKENGRRKKKESTYYIIKRWNMHTILRRISRFAFVFSKTCIYIRPGKTEVCFWQCVPCCERDVAMRFCFLFFFCSWVSVREMKMSECYLFIFFIIAWFVYVGHSLSRSWLALSVFPFRSMEGFDVYFWRVCYLISDFKR